jgi:hypothetical protein
MTLSSRSTQDQRGNCKPILAIVHLYRILQLVVFIWGPFTLTRSRPDITGIDGLVPPALTLGFRYLNVFDFRYASVLLFLSKNDRLA